MTQTCRLFPQNGRRGHTVRLTVQRDVPISLDTRVRRLYLPPRRDCSKLNPLKKVCTKVGAGFQRMKACNEALAGYTTRYVSLKAFLGFNQTKSNEHNFAGLAKGAISG